MKHFSRSVAIAGLCAFCIGCPETKQAMPVPDLSVPVAVTTQSRIYVIQMANTGMGILMKVFDNDDLVGRTEAGSYLVWDRPPGDAFITAKSGGPCSISLHCEAGQSYYILEKLELKFTYHCELEQIDEAHGRELVKHCQSPYQLAHPSRPDLSANPRSH